MSTRKIFEQKDAEICALSLDIIFKEMGLQQAIIYLYTLLQAYFPITRIFCGFKVIDRPVFYPVADTLVSILELTQVSHGSYNTLDEKKFAIHRGTLEPYFPDISPEQTNFHHGISRDEDSISQMRIPLFIQDERVFQIALCSNQPNIFSDKDLPLAKILVKEVAVSILSGRKKIEQLQKNIDINSLEGHKLLALSRGLNPLLKDIKKISATEYNTLIEGETGVGKDLVAQTIHYSSQRKNKPFIKINCGAINESLIESELFGYEKGAFTGATISRKGFFEAAQGGSIFLDEIGELPLKLQASLLRVIENKCIQKVGSNQEIPVDVRIIAATNRNLEDSVKAGNFRLDLWYRLNVFPLKVPPLRLHREDIPVLVTYFIQKSLLELNISGIPSVASHEMNKLYDHSWPGNIRELKNIVEKAIIKAKEGNSCQPLEFEINYQQYKSTQKEEKTKSFVTMDEYCLNYAKQVLLHTHGKITGKDGAASILNLHPNTVRQYKNRLMG